MGFTAALCLACERKEADTAEPTAAAPRESAPAAAAPQEAPASATNVRCEQDGDEPGVVVWVTGEELGLGTTVGGRLPVKDQAELHIKLREYRRLFPTARSSSFTKTRPTRASDSRKARRTWPVSRTSGAATRSSSTANLLRTTSTAWPARRLGKHSDTSGRPNRSAPPRTRTRQRRTESRRSSDLAPQPRATSWHVQPPAVT